MIIKKGTKIYTCPYCHCQFTLDKDTKVTKTDSKGIHISCPQCGHFSIYKVMDRALEDTCDSALRNFARQDRIDLLTGNYG